MRARARQGILTPIKHFLTRALRWGASPKVELRRSLTKSRRAQARAGREARSPDADAAALPSDAPDCVVASNRHGAYCVPRAALHRPVSKTILRSRVWESETLDLVRTADPRGDIVHAGTFFGDF